ncbi:uncharacterized protein C9orf43 homolog [Sceloporus undulatus]|uniref:uncharacterized protein C9orf43 homolog n=1 Tax=Sceloporus undulatus TaxID=8520 RepID=UPI001C4BE07A|nr:uncharacterized protein C9orf43 homolog [Sceloporus undulatus]
MAGSAGAGRWDETVCDSLACQHPPCWEALRRVESGNPRPALAAPGRRSPPEDGGEQGPACQGALAREAGEPSWEPDPTWLRHPCSGELPTLKIVNLPLNCSWRERIKGSDSYGSISKAISSMKDDRSYFSSSPQNEPLMPPVSVLSSERDPFPGLNSRVDSQTPHFLPISLTCWRQAEKIQVTDISEFAIHRLGYQLPCGNLVVRWIPSTRPKPLRPQKPAARAVTPPQRMCVKDLLLESNLAFKEIQGEMVSEQTHSTEKKKNQAKSPPEASLTSFISGGTSRFRLTHQGSVPSWHRMPGLMTQLDRADAPSHRTEGGKGKITRMFQESSTEGCRPPGPPETHPRKKQLVKSVECKNMRNNLLTVGEWCRSLLLGSDLR